VVRDAVPRDRVRTGNALGLAVGGVDIHQIDVGAEVELAAAELAHADDRKTGRPYRSVLRRDDRRSEPRAQFSIVPDIRRLEADLGKVRQLGHRFRQISPSHQVPEPDPKHLPLPVLPESTEQVLIAVDALECSGKPVGQMLLVRRMGEELGMTQKTIGLIGRSNRPGGKEPARPEQDKQRPQHRGPIAHVLDELRHRIELGQEPFQMVQRHVGIARAPERGQEIGENRRKGLHTEAPANEIEVLLCLAGVLDA
jgi:hypothetical protein